MEFTPKKEEKIRDISQAFKNLIGNKLTHYHTLDLLLEDGNYERCDDLPIILFFEEVDPVSVCWSKTEDLAIAFGICLPFGIGGQTTRWVENDLPELKPLLRNKLQRVYLAGESPTMWNRLILEFNSGNLHIFNAGDENGYSVSTNMADSLQRIQCA